MGYQEDEVWKKLQSYLPDAYRLTDALCPSEQYIHYFKQDIHIDLYPQEQPKGRVVLLHGVGGNGRLLSCFALPLWQQGYEVVCPDLPLYGYTKVADRITYDLWVECAVTLVRQYARDNIPLFVFGFSAGGMLAYQVACRCKEVKGILATCILDQRDPRVTSAITMRPWLGRAAPRLSALANRLFPTWRMPLKWIVRMHDITNNPHVTKLLMRDAKSSGARIPFSFLYSMLRPRLETEPEAFTQCPFCLLHPADDRWTDVSLSRLFFDRLACVKWLYMLDGAGHFPTAFDVKQKILNFKGFFADFLFFCRLFVALFFHYDNGQ